MSQESKIAINKKIENLDEIIAELKNTTSENEIVPKDLYIAIQELSDGYVNSVATLTEIFIEASRGKISNNAIKFGHMPITNSIENYPYPIILINDEQELDLETQRIVRNRSENGYVTFPVVLLSDHFFRLAYGEKFSYNDIIKTFEDSIHEKVMVFRKSEFRFLKEYLLFVSKLALIIQLKDIIKELHGYLFEEAEKIKASLDNSDSFASISLIARFNAISEINTDIGRIDGKLDSQIIEWNAEIANIREQYDRIVLEEITHVKADAISPFVLNIDLKYGMLQGYIKDFLNLRELRNDYDFISDDLNQLVNETRLSVNQNRAKLSLIGTFSSGKTTLVNTFLGKRDIPLGTSMKHNTAVLMHLFYEPTPNEYYDIIYKKKVVWTVVKPDSGDKAVVNKESENIRIMNIEKDNGNYRIHYFLTRSKEQRMIRLRTGSDLILAVKSGDVLKTGEPFAVQKKHSDKVIICSKAEIQLLINMISASSTGKVRNLENEIARQPAVDLLKRIYSIASETDIRLSYEEFCKKIGIRPNNSDALIAKPAFPTKYRRIEAECMLSRDKFRKKLDRNGWLELCGDPNPQNVKKSPVFSERPECYMLAKELQLHVHAEFLQYCSVTDTPGFGSVTEEHDAITERYIRDSSGRLLVMIAINARTKDAKFQDLINSIDDIYSNFRKSDKKNVTFILNCFTHSINGETLRKQIEDVYQILLRYGFNKNNIFVCNLHKALIEKQQMDTMFNHPSYKRFHDFIITEMISNDLTMKYRGIQSNWLQFFRNSKNRLDDQIYKIESNIDNIQSSRRSLRETIDRVNGIYINDECFDADSLKNEFESMYSDLENAYVNNRKGFFETIRWNAITEALGNVKANLQVCNDDLVESIYDYYNNLIRKISYSGESSISEPELYEPYESIVVLDTERLTNTLSEADDETHWYNKSEQVDYYTDKILEIIQSGFDQSVKKAYVLCAEYSRVAIQFKESIIREKQSLLRNLENEQDMRRYLEKLKQIRSNVSEIEKRFKRIRFI